MALLSVINFSSDQQRLLEFLGVDPVAAFEAFSVTSLYQDLLRGNLRVAGAGLPDGKPAYGLDATCPTYRA